MHHRHKFWQNVLEGVKIVLVFAGIFIITFLTINFPAYWSKARYLLAKHPANIITTNSMLDNMARDDNHLFIPKLALVAPISWNIVENEIDKPLEKGLAHYAGTALPGQIGNVFVFGHSSNYWWNKGLYKEIFANLDQVQVGDKIYISYQNKVYTYVINNKKVIYPNDISVLAQTPTKTLTLMTCVPVGTSLKRLVVTANQVEN